MSENPYRPPLGDGKEDVASQKKANHPTYDTRWQATRAGFRRGAVLGMTTIAIIIGFIQGSFVLGILFGWIPRKAYPESWMTICLQSIIGIIVTGLIVGAIPGGIIMGVIETVRFRKSK
ncbi:MAG: hypothetical protein JXM70_15770 [Pirellulales bacterium]|nr:hypothetical protein [Pirellulales bacterium]